MAVKLRRLVIQLRGSSWNKDTISYMYHMHDVVHVEHNQMNC